MTVNLVERMADMVAVGCMEMSMITFIYIYIFVSNFIKRKV